MDDESTFTLVLAQQYCLFGLFVEAAVEAIDIDDRGGVRRCDSTALVPQILDEIRSGNKEAKMRGLIGVRMDTFDELLQTLKGYGLKDGWKVSADEKLFIYLHICRTGLSLSKARWILGRDTCTLSSIFNQVTHSLCKLHKDIVKLPEDTVDIHPSIATNPKLQPFKDAVGAIDGTHIPISVPEEQQLAWWNRKHFISQNVLAVVDFDLNFMFVYPGWEGSAHDLRVFDKAIEDGLTCPRGKYYLADAGYTNRQHTMLLTPYYKTRYHLREVIAAGQKPETKEELFNLRHSQLRNCIERVFGVLKARFEILLTPRPNRSIEMQTDLIFALTALHNFMNVRRDDTPGMNSQVVDEEPDNLQPLLLRDALEQNSDRDRIAESCWRQYQAYIEAENEDIEDEVVY